MHPFVHVGDLTLPTYGLFYLTAYLAAISLAARVGTRLGIPFSKTFDVAFQFSIAGEIGSRLTFVLVEWEAFFGGEISMRQFFFAARVVFGGLVAGALWGLWLFKTHRLPILALMDACLAGVARFGWEFLRDDPGGAWLRLSTSQWIGLVMAAVGVVVYIWSARRGTLERYEPPKAPRAERRRRAAAASR